MNPSEKFHRLKDAIRHALVNYENPRGSGGKIVLRGEALQKLADALIHMALNGNDRDKLAAIKELADRLDGKSVQAITGPSGEPITVIQRVIVHHRNELEEKDVTPAIESERSKDGESVH